MLPDLKKIFVVFGYLGQLSAPMEGFGQPNYAANFLLLRKALANAAMPANL